MLAYAVLVLLGSVAAYGQIPASAPISFRTAIAPILEAQCLGCHNASKLGGGLSMASRDAVVRKTVVPGRPESSSFYLLTAAGAMPPGGPKLPAEQIENLRRWIATGAEWPSGLTLKVPAAVSAKDSAERIAARIAKAPKRAFAPYRLTIPNSTVAYDMVPIPAGEFIMGSSANADESPARKVKLDAFWMQAHEVTWDEYRLFMFAKMAGESGNPDEAIDGVSRPTRPYVEMSFGMGIDGFPAISMTQHGANKYAEWLSAKTGEFYRLPTEAEWEYACRAGASGAPAAVGDSAWFAANSAGKYQLVAKKKPNAWGLYDMLGNVMEWTLDEYKPYATPEQEKPQANPWAQATASYPHAVRGGSWNDLAAALTCTARVASDASWKQQDPQLPKSIWYMTDAQWLGFRLVRPRKVPDATAMFGYWNSGLERDEQ